MRIIFASFMTFLALILTTGHSRAFDCKKAYLPVDFVICSAPEVVSANEAHEKAWYEVRSNLNETQKADLLNDQRRWLRELPPRCGVPIKGKAPDLITKNMQFCVQTALGERTDFLRRYPTAAVSSSAPQEPRLAVTRLPVEKPEFEIGAGYQVQCGFANVSNHQDPLPNALASRQDFPTRREDRFDVSLTVSGRGGEYGGVDATIFFNDDKLRQFLDQVRIAARTSCEKAVSRDAAGTFLPGKIEKLPNFYFVRIFGTAFAACYRDDCGFISAYSAGRSGSWTIVSNSIRPIIEEQRAQEQARAAAVAQAQAEAKEEFSRKSALHATVFGKFGLNKLTSLDQLQANPFIMKGQTVAVLTSFDRMISETEAFFLHYGFMTYPGLYVSGVPATRFRSHEQVILFVRVAGLQEVKGALTPTLPHGEYVEAYSCRQTDCAEMTLW
jgi:hypothetical protein